MNSRLQDPVPSQVRILSDRCRCIALHANEFAPTRSYACAGPNSKRPRHAEHVLADVGQDEVGGDRRDLIEARLAKLALDVELAGETESAERLETRVGRLP